MRKRLKKLTAVVLTAGMFASSLFVNGVTAKAEEETGLKKGTVISDFKEITDVKDLEAGKEYFFSLEKFGVEDAVAALPKGSAILKFAGTDVKEGVEAGTFEIYPDYYESFDSYVQYMHDELAMYFPLTEEAVYELIAMQSGFVPTSWDEVLEKAGPEFAEMYPTVEDYIEDSKKQYEEELANMEKRYGFSKGESAFLEKKGFDTWKEFAEYEIEDRITGEIPYLEDSFSSDYVQQEQDGYVAVVQRGSGFDECNFGTIAYLVEETEEIKADAENFESKFEGEGWYYGCNGGAVGYVGPFYLYSYKVVEFVEDDLIITFADDWQAPTTAAKIGKKDVTLSVVVDGEEIFIPFFELTDSSVDPTNDDTTITLKVGEIEKVVEVCNVEPGDVETDVQIGEGAPTVGLEDAVDALKEAVLTEAELKLVGNGVDIDIYMTVVGKEAENLGDDKAAIEKIMGKDDKAVYLDLKLFKKVGNNDPTAISEVPGGKIKVSIEVPDSVKAFAANAKVVRVHGTEVTELTTTYDATTNKLTFETDKFSTYAIVYNESNDADNNNNNNNPDEGNKPGDGGQTPEPPKTGDASMVLLYMAVVAMSGAVVIKRKKITEM